VNLEEKCLFTLLQESSMTTNNSLQFISNPVIFSITAFSKHGRERILLPKSLLALQMAKCHTTPRGCPPDREIDVSSYWSRNKNKYTLTDAKINLPNCMCCLE
jgi:hypothetical protein